MWSYTKCTAGNRAFHVVSIDDMGIRREGLPCKSIGQTVQQFMAQVKA